MCTEQIAIAFDCYYLFIFSTNILNCLSVHRTLYRDDEVTWFNWLKNRMVLFSITKMCTLETCTSMSWTLVLVYIFKFYLNSFPPMQTNWNGKWSVIMKDCAGKSTKRMSSNYISNKVLKNEFSPSVIRLDKICGWIEELLLCQHKWIGSNNLLILL